MCRRTTLAPRFGNPISQILNIPAPPTYNDGIMEQKSRTQAYYAFSTGRKVIGVGSLPLTGNPSKIMGIVAHPNEVTSIAVSFDGNFVFSTGGKDLTANMWKINLQDEEDTAAMNNIVNQSYKRTNNNYLNLENDEGDNLQSRSTKSSDDLKAFYTLLEGGQDGELHRDIIDYFYYCELRHLGEETMDKRQLKGTLLAYKSIQEFLSLISTMN